MRTVLFALVFILIGASLSASIHRYLSFLPTM